MSAMVEEDEAVTILNENDLFADTPDSPRAASETSTLSNASTPRAQHNSPDGRKFFNGNVSTTPKSEHGVSFRVSTTPKSAEFQPKGNLLKPTASRLNMIEFAAAKKKAHEDKLEEEHLKRTLSFKDVKKTSPTKSPAKKAPVGPSDRLMKTTQNRILDIRELENRKDRIKPEDDIWWEMRKLPERAHKKHDVPSKLFQPTQSYVNASRDKYAHRTADSPAPEETLTSPIKKVQKIDLSSPLLKPTRATEIASWGADTTVYHKRESFKPTLCETGPQGVTSKLHKDTYASTTQKWKSKEQIASEQAAEIQISRERIDALNHFDKPVKDVSERLLAPNTNAKMSMRRKSIKDEGDPREAGWRKSFVQGHIPLIDEPGFAGGSPSRRNSCSPATSIRSGTGSGAGAAGSSNGHRRHSYTTSVRDDVSERSSVSHGVTTVASDKSEKSVKKRTPVLAAPVTAPVPAPITTPAETAPAVTEVAVTPAVMVGEEETAEEASSPVVEEDAVVAMDTTEDNTDAAEAEAEGAVTAPPAADDVDADDEITADATASPVAAATGKGKKNKKKNGKNKTATATTASTASSSEETSPEEESVPMDTATEA